MKRWPTKPLGELLKVQNGFAFKSELFNERVKWGLVADIDSAEKPLGRIERIV
jgi:hypothetical protein